MEIDADLLQESYAQLYELVGPEMMYQIFELYRGRQISFPMRLYDRNKVSKKVISEYNGKNLADLTKKYDYSQRWLRQMIQDGK